MGEKRRTDKLITDKPYCRILGANLQNILTWDAHLSKGKKSILPAVRRQIGMIYKLSTGMSEKAKLKLMNALAVSKLTYAICMWGNSTSNHIRKAQVVLNSAARLVTGLKKTTRQQTLMTRCNWLDIPEMTSYYSLTQLWKTVYWRLPLYLKEQIVVEDDRRLSCCTPRLQLTTNNYRHKTIRNWNQLPDHLREENNIKIFNTEIRKWILEKRDMNDALDDSTGDDDRPQSGLPRPPDDS